MKLSHIINNLDVLNLKGDSAAEITSIAFDSRQVGQGTLFVAIPGTAVDGHEYLDNAIKMGASAVLVQKDVQLKGIPVVRVRNCRQALAKVAATFYGYPAKKMKIIGVTGTNGKTTTTHMIAAVLEAYGYKTGLIGTLYIKSPSGTRKARVTTPESLEIQRYLSQMVEEGVDVVVMEVSSHALYFDRVAGIEFAGAVFTNLTQDHLDFHQNLDEYFAQKKKLFSRIITRPRPGFALVNSDDPRTREIVADLEVPYKSYGIYKRPDVRAREIKTTINSLSFIAESEKWDVPVKMPMAGLFNVYNALAAVGVGLFMNVPPALITRGLSQMPPVRGRFEIIDQGQPFGVVVDYAHTPDGLSNLLLSAREITDGRVITVFGCGGDRDRTKRPLMGRVVAELADVTIVTSDNPRSEDPRAIINDILPGIEQVTQNYLMEPDRRSAIKLAIETARVGDIVVIAGKGHEDYQILADRTIHFDDAEEARNALSALSKTNSLPAGTGTNVNTQS